jgi:hypothetical protein
MANAVEYPNPHLCAARRGNEAIVHTFWKFHYLYSHHSVLEISFLRYTFIVRRENGTISS